MHVLCVDACVMCSSCPLCSSSMHRTANALLILLTIIGTTSFFRSGALQLQPQPPHGGGVAGAGACVPSERAALLDFKKGITSDPARFLSSWHGWDCCRWRGVTCSNRTGHVLKLDLRNRDPDIYFFLPTTYKNALEGEISLSLLSLEHLEHLDLSMNYWGGKTSQMPSFLGSMRNLRYLNLSGIHFTGSVPPQFGNLSKLQCLDISDTVHSADITLFANLPMLQYLSMSQMNLSWIVDWPQKLNMIPSLRVIDLSDCFLDRANQSLRFLNLTKLEKLDLSGNYFDHTIASCWFWKATGLKYLNLGGTSLFGQFGDTLENMTSLQVLDLSYRATPRFVNLKHDGYYCQHPTWIEDDAMIPYTLQMVGNFQNLCSLQILDLSDSYKSGDLTTLMDSLPRCAWEELQELRLSCNNFTGTLPNSIGRFTSLTTLELSDNNLSGIIPPWLGNCTRLSTLHIYNNHLNGSVPTEIGVLKYLTSLDVSNNQLSGVITEEHLKGLTSLSTLDLSYNNNLKVVTVEGWFPPFRLDYGIFASCQIGPVFPAWLQQQLSIRHLDISSTGVKDKIPDWFWSTVSQATYLDMSDNQLTGRLPARLDDMALTWLNLSSNYLTGPVPPFPRNIKTLDISHNSFSGMLPLSYDGTELEILVMFANQIGGGIPESMCNLPFLTDLDLSSNLLEGQIPQCFANMTTLNFLLLSNNSLEGIFPTFLRNYTDLRMLDLSWNKFSGELPTWIGELTGLVFLRLGHNKFFSNIPLEISYLGSLQFLDLSSNNLSGVIPQHLANLTGMTTLNNHARGMYVPTTYSWGQQALDVIYEDQFDELFLIITKGQQLLIRALEYFVSIDLSDNSLSGEIPRNMTSLDALINLNLSVNHLSGKIPNKIGAVMALESLDLSENKLSGEIPSSLSNLTSLSYMNLSYNNLSGRIPSGRQLDTLNAENPSIMYIGNTGLCGPPLQNKCPGNGSFIHGNGTSYRHELEPFSFLLGLVLGLVVGLWMVFCALLFKKTWRLAFFQLFDKFYDTAYVYVVLKLASLTRNAEVE